MKIYPSLSASSAVLYHATDLPSARNIIHDNVFLLAPSATSGIEAEQAPSVSDVFFLSTTRSKVGAYTRSKARPGSVVLRLNGRALGSRYKVKPVDYWGTIDMKSTELRDTRNEREDRLFSRSAEIPNARKYVEEVHVWMPVDENSSLLRFVFDLFVDCKRGKIKFYAYNTEQDFLLQVKKNAVKLNFTHAPVKQMRVMRRPIRRSTLVPYLELFVTPVRNAPALSKDAKWVLRSLGYTDGPKVYETELHNAKNSDKGDGSKGRETLVKLTGIMSNMRLTNKQFCDYLHKKWSAPGITF